MIVIQLFFSMWLVWGAVQVSNEQLLHSVSSELVSGKFIHERMKMEEEARPAALCIHNCKGPPRVRVEVFTPPRIQYSSSSSSDASDPDVIISYTSDVNSLELLVDGRPIPEESGMEIYGPSSMGQIQVRDPGFRTMPQR